MAPMFDEHSLMQKAAGLSNPCVFRSADDKSEIVVVFDTKDTKRSKDFAASPDLRETMAKAGVMDDPTIFFLEFGLADAPRKLGRLRRRAKRISPASGPRHKG